jgi:hypothetical protein
VTSGEKWIFIGKILIFFQVAFSAVLVDAVGAVEIFPRSSGSGFENAV